MHFLLIHLFGLLSFTTPLTCCNRNSGTPPASIYTVSQHTPDRDSVNSTLSGSRRNAITVAVAKASPAVVGINVTEVHEVQYQQWDPFGWGNDPFMRQMLPNLGVNRTQKYQVKALGSGFIISPDGYVLTNDHVAGNATKIIVTTSGGKEYDAKVVGTDHTNDITLLKIEGSGLPSLTLGNSNDIAVGEWAIALGNPFGLFAINDKPTVTVGVISNTGMNLGLEGGRNYRDMIQTDAAISGGNSGGPLLNANGEVIGMNATIKTSAANAAYGEAVSIGLGFAIPINKIKTVVDRIRTGEKINHDIGNLGMGYYDITDEIKEYFKLSSDVGVVVTQVNRNSPADMAGIHAGDIITSIGSEKTRSADGLRSALADHEVGETVKLHILRDGKDVDARLILPSKPTPPRR